MLDDTDEFASKTEVDLIIERELGCNIGSALFTNHNLFGIWLAYKRLSLEDSLSKLRAFYLKHREMLDLLGDGDDWLEIRIQKAMQTNNFKESRHAR